MIRLSLASRSPFRLQLLKDAGYDVVAVPSGIVEADLAGFANVNEGLTANARMKALASRARGATGLILAADTVGSVHGKVLGKPTGRDDAVNMLRAISGTVHEVLTGWCLLGDGDPPLAEGVERTQVTMRPWTEDELTAYLDSGNWQGKCGAYGLQWPSDPFVTRLEGSVSNVIGVPLERLRDVLVELRLG